MLKILPADQIEDVLRKNVIGRLGCHADGETYVVPINFVYNGKALYSYTLQGKKTAMMQKNPRVCFQTDEMGNGNWRSVIVQGVYEEVTETEERHNAMQLLSDRYLPFVSSVKSHLGANWPFHPGEQNEIDGIVFRIDVLEKSGRFESFVYAPTFPG